MIVRIITYERSTLVNDEKYIGLDVHQATISVAVMNATHRGLGSWTWTGAQRKP